MNDFTLNVLVIDDEETLITKAREAYTNSFEVLNNRASLGVKIGVFPYKSEQKQYITNLVECAIDSEEYQNETLVFNYIKTYLDKYKINVILLDFIITVEDEKKMPTNTPLTGTTGEKLLSSIRKSKYKNIPILGYTQLKNEVQKLKIVEKGPLFQIDKNNFTNNYFKENQSHLHTMIAESRAYQKEIGNQCDIVVVCALKKEIKPVIELLDIDIPQEGSDTLAIGHITNKDNVKLKVIAISKEQMGMAEAATITTQMIEKYNPVYVVMTGIAGGIDREGQNFLNILMPSYIHNWQSGKFKENKVENKVLHVFEREYSSVATYIQEKTDLNIDVEYLKKLPEEFLKSETFEGDFNEESILKYLESIQDKLEKDRSEFEQEIVNLYENEKREIKNKIEDFNKSRKKNKESEVKKLKDKLDNLPVKNLVIDFILEMVDRLSCTIQKDGMVSGSAVVADEYIIEKNINNRKINGIDMEAYGVVYACNHHPQKPKVIILKAICDFADNEKNDIYQSAAAYVSANAFHKLFTEYIDVESKS